MMTRKNYLSFADTLYNAKNTAREYELCGEDIVGVIERDIIEDIVGVIERDIIEILARDNPNFDVYRFQDRARGEYE
jgi:hypothetical protein